MAFKFKEMQPLSIKYFALIYRAYEETILSLNDHWQSFKSGLHQVCQNFKQLREKIKLKHVFHFLGREMVDSLFIEHTSWVFLHSWKLKQVEKLEKIKIRACNFIVYNTVWKQLLSVLYYNKVKYAH